MSPWNSKWKWDKGILYVIDGKIRSYGSRIPMLHENLNCNGLAAVIGKYLISAHLYSAISVLQTWVLGLWLHEDLMDGNWLSAKCQLVGMTDSMHLEFGEIIWYSIKIMKLCQEKPT
jgi:hypothetical protein